MKGSPADRLPDVIIVGAMRSGTTSLFRWLADHPEVFMAPDKELQFFDEHYDRGLSWYAAHFADGLDTRIVGEGTPNYLYDSHAIHRIATDLPSVKVLAVLRSPVDRAYSHYQMLLARGREQRPWEQVIDQELELEERVGKYSVIDRSRYAHQLERMYSAIPRERCHVLPFEHMRNNPGTEFSKVCEFLGIGPIASASLGTRVNAYFRIRSPLVRRAASHAWVPKRVRNIVGRANQVEDPYPPMPPDIRRRVEASFLKERARVIELAGWSEDPWQSHSI